MRPGLTRFLGFGFLLYVVWFARQVGYSAGYLHGMSDWSFLKDSLRAGGGS